MKKKESIRTLKKSVRKKLLSAMPPTLEDLLDHFTEEQLIAPLISCFCNSDPTLKWRAILVFAQLVNRIADKKIEKARIIMRRLMWTLNEESGGVGWGAPEAMGEIMRLNNRLAEEYHNILFSYIDDHGNFLDYEPLQIGTLWGIYRLGLQKPELVKKVLPASRKYLASGHATGRGLAMKISGLAGDESAEPLIRNLLADKSEIELFEDGVFKKFQLRKIAEKTLSKQPDKK